MRLPNLRSGYNDKIRVENEVAALSLARDALETRFPGLVPRVFGWGSAKDGQGWMLQEHLTGSPLLLDFGSMSPENKVIILRQMADILSTLQQHQLPPTIQDYGGLDFGPSGEYISGPMSIMDAGPFPTYEGLVRATILSKLAKADTDAQVLGWQSNGVRARLNNFVDQGLHDAMKNLGSFPKALVHADFGMFRDWQSYLIIKFANSNEAPDNFLYDKSTMQLTGLFDFDFAHIATFADEFFRSLSADIGKFPLAREPGEQPAALRKAMLAGFPNPLPSANEEVDWPSAKAWDDALCESGAQRPSTIAGITALSDLFWLSGQILPFRLCNEVVVQNSSEEQLAARKKDGEGLLIQFLDDYGF